MNYIISEEELLFISENLDTDEGRAYIIDKLTEIKSKTPVEEVASDTVTGFGVINDFCYIRTPKSGDIKVNNIPSQLLGKNIKIYIEVVK